MVPTVSVILNCYNHELYVAEAVDSVLAQTFTDFELILIDNGSTDGSRKVLERYDDPRIRRFFHDENQSLSRRLNEGVAAARGEFVAVLYSDDWMLPDKLERQVALFGTLGPEYGVVYCPALGFNQLTGESWQYPIHGLSGDMLPAIFREHWKGQIDMSSPLIRRECLVRYRFYDDLPFEGEAVFMWVALAYRFHFDDAPTVVLRDHGSNVGKAVKANHEMVMELIKRFEQHHEFPDACSDTLQRFKAMVYREHGWYLLRLNADEAAYVRKRLIKAVMLDRSQMTQPRFFAAWALAVLPRPIRRALNNLANRWTHHPGSRSLVEASNDC